MLGRTAASLFWMSRYMERAENIARLTEVGYRSALTPNVGGGHREDWQSILAATGCLDAFEDRKQPATAEAMRTFLLLDADHPSSVRSCFETARNNARAVRTALTSEMWEALNSTWNELAAAGPDRIGPAQLPEFLEWIRQRSALFRGATMGTLLRTEGFHFSQIGAFLERGDNTARILKMKYAVLLPGAGRDDRSSYQWETILRSVSAHRAYRHFYQEAYQSEKIAEFLILREEMPRSLRYCAERMRSALRKLHALTDGGAAALKLADERYGVLAEVKIPALLRGGLAPFLDAFIASNAEVADAIAQDFHFV